MGRRCVRGARLLTPEAVAHHEQGWKTLVANLYRKTRKVTYKEMTAQWYRACGAGLNKIIMVALAKATFAFESSFARTSVW